MWDLLQSIEGSNVVQGVNGRGEASMETEDLGRERGEGAFSGMYCIHCTYMYL